MNIHEALQESQEHARTMLVEKFDEQRGIPKRADSHPDLWPGDRWPEAYLAANLPDMAEASMNAIARSQRPDGAFPHLMQGSHKERLGVETRWIDRQVYRLQGNGALRLANGEWVTKSVAPPTQALSALALAKEGIRLPSTVTLDSLQKSAIALRGIRGDSETMDIIRTKHIDELTNNAGDLAQKFKNREVVRDPAINALAILNNHAIMELAEHQGKTVEPTLKIWTNNLSRFWHGLLPEKADDRTMNNEDVLAAARLDARWALREDSLRRVFEQPDPSDTNPGRTKLSMAECIEIARLTLDYEASQEYLARILPKIAQMGTVALTRFEGVMPTNNPVGNKVGRRQVWLPTAAEIVQLPRTGVA